MKPKQINQCVQVTAVRFTEQFETIPSRIEYRGTSYKFTDEGKRVLLKSGDTITRWFDMSDGLQKFRLRSDDERHWQLLSIS